MDEKTEEFFKRLKVQLEENHSWPAEYLFKFIVPTDPAKVEAVENAFNDMGAVIDTRKSRNENFTSVSINVYMENADQVIGKYKEVAWIEGIISL
jgi:putative lipoic acid-binding regulatory protein